MQCTYCLVRRNASSPRLDPCFCGAACQIVLANGARTKRRPRVVFHGLGEPTYHWDQFRTCVEVALEASRAWDWPLDLVLCTGGQLDSSQARYVAERFQEVQVSLDGPERLQTLHRKRRDTSDSFAPALNTACVAAFAKCKVVINVTVTESTVKEMPEVVRFVAEAVGNVVVCFEPLLITAASPRGVNPPSPSAFLEGFSLSLDLAERLPVAVTHSTISIPSILAGGKPEAVPIIILPDGTVREYVRFDQRGNMVADAGVCGRYDHDTHSVAFTPIIEPLPTFAEKCVNCICYPACCGRSLIRTAFDGAVGREICEINRGVLALLLERASRRSASKPYSDIVINQDKKERR